MTAKVVWIDAIIQRPVIRLRTSRSASRSDSPAKRSASSPERPIVLPSRIPETDSDSWTSDEMSAIAPCRRSSPSAAARRRASSCRRRAAAARARSGEPPVEQEHRDDRREHRGHVRDDRRRGRRDDVVDTADVVRDPALHLAGARPREERERQALQVAVDRRCAGRASRVCPTLFEWSVCTTPSAPVTTEIAIIPPTSARQQPASGVAGSRCRARARSRNGETTPSAAETRISAQTADSRRRYGPEEPGDPAQVGLAHRLVGGALGHLGRTRSRGSVDRA